MELCLKRGFILPSCEIYNQMAGFYDYGPLGCAVKNKILAVWRDFCIRQEGFVEIDGSTILKGNVLEASGHATQFVDPIVKCTKCREAFRADHLVGEAVKGRFSAEGLSPGELDSVLKSKNVKCQKCGGPLGQVEVFNLMFKLGVGAGEGTVAYLRPETAQSIFCDFHRVFKAERERLPLGIAQIGRAYRNEISPRQGLLRMREFTQMEMEIFVDPEKIGEAPGSFMGDAKIRLLTQDEKLEVVTAQEAVEKGIVPNKTMAHWLAKEFLFYRTMGVPFEKMRMRHMPLKETPFYSKANFDLEVETSLGWKETIGNAYRTDHDLSTHSKHSGKDLSVMTRDGRRIVPHVIEPSWGFDRLFYCVMEHAYMPKGERSTPAQPREWSWLRLPKQIAPYTAIVCPLMNKDELVAKAQAIYDALMKEGLDVFYDASGNIGKRYARADEVGIPFAVTIDYDTLNDNAVTVRDRDTTKQDRVKIEKLAECLKTA